VGSTILLALISRSPTGDAVRRWFQLTPDAWISSEIALTRMLLAISSSRHEPWTGAGLVRVLNSAVAIRPLPLRLLSRSPLTQRQPARASGSLAMADAQELAAARIWRCHCLISHRAALRQAAEGAGLSSLGIGAPPARSSAATPSATATVGDWPRRSPILP
jgi:hypothetical protein